MEKTTAEKIKTLRARTGLSQPKFGEYLHGIAKRTVASWEGGTRECPVWLLALIEEKVNRDFPEEEQ